MLLAQCWIDGAIRCLFETTPEAFGDITDPTYVVGPIAALSHVAYSLPLYIWYYCHRLIFLHN